MRTSSTWPALAPSTATGPVQMWPGTTRRVTLRWIAASAGGTTSGGRGITSALPDTVEIVTVSPLAISATGARVASKNPQCTVSGDASMR